jgi:hypothetical protein
MLGEKRHKSGWTRAKAGVVGLLVLTLFASAAWSQDAAGSKADEIAHLLSQALDAKTPEQKLDYAKQVILLDPNNQTALELRKEASQELETKHKSAAEQARQREEQQTKQSEGGLALKQATVALLVGNLALARSELTRAKQLGKTGKDVGKLDAAISGAELKNQQIRYVQIGAAGTLLVGLAGVLLWTLRKRDPFVEVLGGDAPGMRYLLANPVTRIGSVAEAGEIRNDIVISDRAGTVSRTHCEVHNKNGKLYLVDCNSSNGTYLNGQRIMPRRYFPLRSGARIELSRSTKLRIGYQRKRS